MKRVALYIMSACLLLAGCAESVPPAATADQVLAAQYRARGPRGVTTGAEAGIIAQAYRKNIAAPAAPMPDMTSGK